MESKVEAEEHACAKAEQEVTSDIFHGLTVAQAIGERDLSDKLPLHYTLGDLARALYSSRRSATAVADCDGHLVGLLTENDLMRAYYDGASPHVCLNDWLAGGKARAPAVLLRKLTVRPSALLSEVAERMVANAMAGDCACHHVLVKGEDERLYAVLSAEDMVKALCRPEMLNHPVFHGGEKGTEATPVESTVQDFMKLRETVFTCPPTNTMKDVLKVLLMTQQNSALVVDEQGIYGIVTPRDAVRAFYNGVSSSVCIADWLREQPGSIQSKVIPADAKIADAAAAMTARDADHLVVVLPGSMLAVGVLSSLDLVLSTKAAHALFPMEVHSPILRSKPLWAGPRVDVLISQDWHHAIGCDRKSLLGDVAKHLAATGSTSATVLGDADSPPLGLLTEDDLMQAFLAGRPRTAAVGEWLMPTFARPATVPPHLLVPPTMPLTDAASLMLSSAEPGRVYHHLVVQGLDGRWVGVFSALDVARGLCALCSDLEVALTFADQTTCSMVMKPLEVVPTCRPDDSIHAALSQLAASGQNAALVVDEHGTHGLITPRCAMQALAAGTPHDCKVASWLQHRRRADVHREVPPDCRLLQAAHIMAEHNLHHLIVAEHGRPPMGVLSSLDLARGVASSNCPFPFLSLAWLRLCKGPSSCTVRGGSAAGAGAGSSGSGGPSPSPVA